MVHTPLRHKDPNMIVIGCAWMNALGQKPREGASVGLS